LKNLLTKVGENYNIGQTENYVKITEQGENPYKRVTVMRRGNQSPPISQKRDGSLARETLTNCFPGRSDGIFVSINALCQRKTMRV